MDDAFANILLTGPCNLRCPDCIGAQLRHASASTLDDFPLPGLDAFVNCLRTHRIREVSLTGIDTEPMLHRHCLELVERLRADVPGVRISLHTNGTRVLDDLETFDAFDRATVSLPSLTPSTCLAMTGSPRVLDVEAIVRRTHIPIKLSVLMTEHNRQEIPSMLERVRAIGYRRVVLRRRYGEPRPYDPLRWPRPVRWFGGNPVYDLDGLEVTVWDFDSTCLRCVNLFPDGSVRDAYRLEEAAHA